MARSAPSRSSARPRQPGSVHREWATAEHGRPQAPPRPPLWDVRRSRVAAAGVPRQRDAAAAGVREVLEGAEEAAGEELLVDRQPEVREPRRHEAGVDARAEVGSSLGAQVAPEE